MALKPTLNKPAPFTSPEAVAAGRKKVVKPEPTEAPEPVSAAATAEIEFMRLVANKGWLLERRYIVLCDFLRAKDLFDEANKFIKRQR